MNSAATPTSASAEVAPNRVLLIRTSALGDIAQSLPVLAALRRALPATQLGWVVDEAFAPLLRGHELIDELIEVPLKRLRRRGAGRGRQLLAMTQRLRAFHADVAIDLMGNHKGAMLARLSGARRRIGAARRNRREPSSVLWINRPVPIEAIHAVDRALTLLAPLGLDGAPVDFAPAALTCGRERIPPGNYLFIHPGAAWANKRYPPALWGRVARRIGEQLALPVLVGAAPGEEQLAEAVAANSAGHARVYPAPSLEDLTGALRGARLVLAGDTGAVHVARALDVPVLAIHGPTDPARHGPWRAPDAVVFRRLPCSFCHRRMDEAKACLLGLDPELVADLALRLAGRSPAGQALD